MKIVIIGAGHIGGTLTHRLSNYYPQQPDGRIEGIEAGATESRWVSQQLGRSVVKAFNNTKKERALEWRGTATSSAAGHN